jgi:AcrR family transcriptional regulator
LADTALKLHPDLLAGENLPPTPRQKRSVERRAQLKAMGLALFGEKGYGGTSIEEIAQRSQLPVGTFYQHFRSKRQLLLVLMDEFLEGLGRLDMRPARELEIRSGLRALLAAAFARDWQYLGACRAWHEAVLSDPDLARKQQQIRAWSTARVTDVFAMLQQLPGARQTVDISALAQVVDGLFWSLLSDATRLPAVELTQSLNAATHLIYHALFTDDPDKSRTDKSRTH